MIGPRTWGRGRLAILPLAFAAAACGGTPAPLTEAEMEYCSSLRGQVTVTELAFEKGRNPLSDQYWNEADSRRGEHTREYIEDCREAYREFGS